MAEFIKNRPFRFWCQKVLPLVYDDSLSYYELLCKVVCKLNELAENQNNLSDEIKRVAKDLDDFKNQVPGMIEAKVEEWLDNYITTHGLVNSVNGMKGDVVLKKLTETPEGGLSISGEDGYNGSEEKTIEIAAGGVTTDKIAEGAVTADKLAGGAIPEKLPNPHKLTFSGAVTGEYDGSAALTVKVPEDVYYTKIPETADTDFTKWSGHLSAIPMGFGVLYLTSTGTVPGGRHTLRLNMTTGLKTSFYGSAAVVSMGSNAHAGTATVTIATNTIDVVIRLSDPTPNISVTIPFVRTL